MRVDKQAHHRQGESVAFGLARIVFMYSPDDRHKPSCGCSDMKPARFSYEVACTVYAGFVASCCKEQKLPSFRSNGCGSDQS
jgi:hypothetical protein